MPIQRKKKTTKRRNPCLPCNPSTRATRFSRIKRNPEYVREFWDEAKAMNMLLTVLSDEQYTLKSNKEIILYIDGDNYLISVEKLPRRNKF